MGRGAVLVASVVAPASLAMADPDPQPTAAPTEVSWYGTATAAMPALPPPRIRRVVTRGGVFLLGGLSVVDAAYARVDLGVPTPTKRFPRLRTALVTELRGATDADDTARRVLVLAPIVQYDWQLPFGIKRGELLLITAVGLRRHGQWVKKPDEPFWPSRWESTTAYALKLTAGLEYRAHSGFIASLQPSLGLPLNTPDPPDARWMTVTPERDVGLSLVVGYQLR
jgi:hypothetical protein